MGRKKKSENPFTKVDVECTYPGQNFHIMYHDMLISPAYMALSDSAKVMLQICRDTRRFYTAGKEGEHYPNAIDDDVLQFYMNRAVLKKYGRNNPNKAHRDLQELVKYGFIEVKTLGATARIKNVYKYSDRWQKLKEGETAKLTSDELYFCTYHPKKKKPKDNPES